jgi:hypothetical protein
MIAALFQPLSTLWQHIYPAKSNEDDEHARKLSLKDIANKSCYIQTPKQCELPLVFCLPPTNEFIGREAELKQLDEAIQAWQDGQGELTCIVAPFGSGLSALLSQCMLNQSMPQHKVVFLSFYQAPLSAKAAISDLFSCFGIQEQPSSITQAIHLIEQQTPQIILIDNMHRLMLRMMGNYQALVTIATILMETRAKHCWIFGCESFAWQRLTSQYQITNFIKTVIPIDYFSYDEMTAFMNNKFSDLDLFTNEDQAEIAERNIKQLQNLSGGHPKLAQLLLLHAFEQIKAPVAQDTVPSADTNATNSNANADSDSDNQQEPLFILQHQLKEICDIDITPLKNCSDDDLFTLAEVYVHGGLTVFQHASVFASTIEQSSLKLEYLSRQGLLIAQYVKHDFASHHYCITPTLTKIVSSHLVNNNKLYQ